MFLSPITSFVVYFAIISLPDKTYRFSVIGEKYIENYLECFGRGLI